MTSNGSDAEPTREGHLGRLSTGIEQLDQILGGGFPKSSIVLVMGHPGTGKTIFAEQLVFHNADGDRPILYLTTMSEPLAKVLTYLQTFSFFDQDRFLEGVVYEDIGSELAERGVDVVVERIREAIRELGPKIIVVDSFKAIHDLAESPREMRHLVSDLGGILSAYDATVFLVGEYAEEQVPQFPEFAVADGIIQFSRRGTAKRDDRFLRLLKLRGSQYAEGLHAFTISSAGLQVFPRLVDPAAMEEYSVPRERVPTGIQGVDEILQGGLWRGSTALVSGAAGSGKTTLGLQFAIEGARRGEPSLFLNFQENPTQLARTIRSLGADPEELREKGMLFHYESPVELRIDTVVVELFDAIRSSGVRRVVVDSLTDLALAADDRQRLHDYLYSLTQHLVRRGVTSLLTYEVSAGVGFSPQEDARFSSVADALFELGVDMSGEPRRTFRVTKARGIGHDMRVHEMRLGESGVRIMGAIDKR